MIYLGFSDSLKKVNWSLQQTVYKGQHKKHLTRKLRFLLKSKKNMRKAKSNITTLKIFEEKKYSKQRTTKRDHFEAGMITLNLVN